MEIPETRRRFLETSTAALGSLLVASSANAEDAKAPAETSGTVRAVVWDERQPAQKKAYNGFLGDAIAAHLRSLDGFSVRSVGLDDPDQGLSSDVLGDCDVLIWWGHIRQGEIKPDVGKKIVSRIKDGSLSLIALHSAHWSTPFVEAMNERTRLDVARTLRAEGKGRLEIDEAPPPKRSAPKASDRLTPYVSLRKFPDGLTKATIQLPICCFPSYREDGKPSYLRVLAPSHPIVAGVPAEFVLPEEEMYDEPFHVPEPDEVLIEERWATGEWFRSGLVWTLGKGRVFYFRPGHETHPTYRQKVPLAIVANAARWLGKKAN